MLVWGILQLYYQLFNMVTSHYWGYRRDWERVRSAARESWFWRGAGLSQPGEAAEAG